MDKDNCKFVKIQICYGEYLWLLAVKHNKKGMEGDSLLEGKHLSLLMDLLEGKCLLLWHRKMRNRRCTLSWGRGGEVSVIVITVGLSSGLRREPNIDIMH